MGGDFSHWAIKKDSCNSGRAIGRNCSEVGRRRKQLLAVGEFFCVAGQFSFCLVEFGLAIGKLHSVCIYRGLASLRFCQTGVDFLLTGVDLR